MTQIKLPVVADVKPRKTTLEAGKDYLYCACGRSRSQPFCDGTHVGTGLAPRKLRADATGEVVLCMCRQSGNAPYCDGTHRTLSQDAVGKELAPPERGD